MTKCSGSVTPGLLMCWHQPGFQSSSEQICSVFCGFYVGTHGVQADLGVL